MKHSIQRSTAWILVAGYLFTVTLAAQFHCHDSRSLGSGCCSDRVSSAECSEASPDECDGPPSGHFPGGESSRSGSLVSVASFSESGKDHCPVCHFLSQNVSPIGQAPWMLSEEVCEASSVVRRVFHGSRSPILHPSRAPPSAV
jgi:hypothetical protein